MLIANLLLISTISIINGILYRMGGSQYYNTKYRDLGCNIICNLLICILLINKNFVANKQLLYSFLIAIPLLIASLTTYWDFLSKSSKENMFTWSVTGFFYGLSALPFIMYSSMYLPFIIRIILLTLFVPLWSKYHPLSFKLFNHTWGGAQIEEFGRGFFLTITLLLLI